MITLVREKAIDFETFLSINKLQVKIGRCSTDEIQYHASFTKTVEIHKQGVRKSMIGFGKTPKESIKNLIRNISEQTITIDSYKNPIQITVPKLKLSPLPRIQ